MDGCTAKSATIFLVILSFGREFCWVVGVAQFFGGKSCTGSKGLGSHERRCFQAVAGRGFCFKLLVVLLVVGCCFVYVAVNCCAR